MKILYAIQATGNGHLARAREIIPCLEKKSNLDLLVSGTQGDLTLPYPVTYQKHGLSFIFGKSGQVDITKTIRCLKPGKLWQDIKSCPVDHYDLIIHDFEPITAHACKRRGTPNISLSHQSSFYYPDTPRPKNTSRTAEWILRNYAPSEHHIGLHFQRYHPAIFTPIIRKEIRLLKTENHNHVVVYLPAYCPYFLASIFQKLPKYQWKIFSKHSKSPFTHQNIEIYPVGNATWLEAFRTCRGLIIGAGFEGPSEALYLGKKLLVIPMKNQYEQKCNAAALKNMDIKVLKKIDHKKLSEINHWLEQGEAQQILFPDNTENIVDQILNVV